MQDMGNPFSPIPFQTVQIIPDGVVAILVGNDADGGFDLLLAGNTVFLHSPQDILHVGVVQRPAGAGPAHRQTNKTELGGANEAFVMEDAAVHQTTGSGTVGVFFFLDLLDDLPFPAPASVQNNRGGAADGS